MAIVEGDRVGGTCVIRGCVPKKLLVYASLVSEQLEGASSYGVSVEGATFDTSVLLRNVRHDAHCATARTYQTLPPQHSLHNWTPPPIVQRQERHTPEAFSARSHE